MRRLRLALLLAACVATASAIHGWQAEPAAALAAQIDRIFKTHEYDPPRFGPARWLPDGQAYAIVERTGRGSEIVRYDAATGARSVLVPASKFVPVNASPGQDVPATGSGLDIDDYEWSADGKRLLIFTNTGKVWRDNTRGDYWVLDLGSGKLTQVGGKSPASSLMFAKFSPDGSRVAYVRDNNIYVEHLATGKTIALTRDGSATTINGTSDWVYEEELGLRDGFRWSPDGTQIAYWQFDTSGVGIFSLIDDTTTLYPTIKRIPYPKVGTTNSAVRIGVVSAEGGSTRWVQMPGDARNNYLARLEWLDPQTVAIEQLNRLQNQNDFYLAEAKSGAARRVFRDASKTWVRWSRSVDRGSRRAESAGSGRSNSDFLWTSERDGWQHVYRVPRTGGDGVLLTRFDGDVTEVVGTDERAGWLYFLASPSNATERYLYRSKLDGPGRQSASRRLISPGPHDYDLAPGGTMAFHTWSQFDRAPVTDVVTLPAHRSLRALTDPAPLQATLAAVVKPPIEFLKVDIGGNVVLDGWMLKPPGFDGARKYPVIVFVYGEPAGQTVTNNFTPLGAVQSRPRQAGYIVVSFDNRGTPAPKGAAWRKVVYGSVGDLSSKEQAAAIRALAARHPFIDIARVGIWGWSGGGTNTLNAMFRFPDLYKAGVAIAPVPDQRLYDTIYQERYMGLPKDNAEGYRIGSAINFAEGLKGKLLIVHGSGDDNVHYQGTERLVNRLVELGKPFDMMVYPNRTHAISEGPGTSAHVYQLIARYFLEHLPV